ncbi:MAG: YigZ family protein [Planctomycetes bacterium]|nr:YigZ family protein [Planctomycetota bacterium]
MGPTESVADALAHLDRVRREFHDARHTCWAYRLGRAGEVSRVHDDGEPSGSAGWPILQQIESHALTDVVVFVTRYFGGTKLGVGGLVRAYAAAAAAALDRVAKRTVIVTRRVIVTYPYECEGAVQAVLVRKGLKPVESSFAEAACLRFDVPIDLVASFVREITDRTSGRAGIDIAQ